MFLRFLNESFDLTLKNNSQFGDKDVYSYVVTNSETGEQFSLVVQLTGTDMYVNWIGSPEDGGVSELPKFKVGPGGIKEIFSKLLKLHPEVTAISGERVTGARFGQFSRGKSSAWSYSKNKSDDSRG